MHLAKDKLFKTSSLCKMFIKILEVNFGNSILDNSKWNKISEGIAKNPYLELRGKKIIVNQKIRPPRYLAQISIWMIGLGILDIDTQLNSPKIKWIQRLLNPTNALWKNLIMLYQLNLILNHNQELVLFR